MSRKPPFHLRNLIRSDSGDSSIRLIMMAAMAQVPVYFWLCWRKEYFANPGFAAAFFGMVSAVAVGKAIQTRWEGAEEVGSDDGYPRGGRIPDYAGEALVGHGSGTQYELSDFPESYPPAFRNAMVFILNHETVWTRDGSVKVERDPRDPGGTTKYGIDQASHKTVDVASLTLEQALDIYLDEWVRYGCANMSDKVGLAYFDAAVNCGKGHARTWLAHSQKDWTDEKIAAEICDAREHYYRFEVRKSLGKIYLPGWLNRLRDLRRALGL